MRRIIAAAVLVFLALGALAFGQTITRVVDGDTIHVDGIGSVRLIGVDTPESVDPRKPIEFFAKESGEFTRRMASGKGRPLRVRLSAERQIRPDPGVRLSTGWNIPKCGDREAGLRPCLHTVPV